jgi:hypothetical protein
MFRMNTTEIPKVPDCGIRAGSHLQTGYKALYHGTLGWRMETRASTHSIKVALISSAMHPIYAKSAVDEREQNVMKGSHIVRDAKVET